MNCLANVHRYQQPSDPNSRRIWQIIEPYKVLNEQLRKKIGTDPSVEHLLACRAEASALRKSLRQELSKLNPDCKSLNKLVMLAVPQICERDSVSNPAPWLVL